MIEKASIYTMNALNKSSELWHTSVNRKARPVVEGEHNKSWNDHVHGVHIIDITIENKCMTVWNFYYSENHELSVPFEIFLKLNISSWKKNLRN